jgi:hypothetical protein
LTEGDFRIKIEIIEGLKNMTIYKEFIEQIIYRRDAILSELIGKDGLNLKYKVKNVEGLIDLLDRIFYTIDFLQKEGLIECNKKSHNINDDLFGLPFGEDVKRVYPTMYLCDLWESAAGWQIKIKPGLIHFKQQGYLTDAQLKERNQFWLIIASVVLASFLTSLFTLFLPKIF